MHEASAKCEYNLWDIMNATTTVSLAKFHICQKDIQVHTFAVAPFCDKISVVIACHLQRTQWQKTIKIIIKITEVNVTENKM